MPDQIRSDRPVITRSGTAKPSGSVVFDGAGGFRVAAPSASAVMAVRTAVTASLVEGPLNFAYSTSSNTSLEMPADAMLLGLSLSRQTALSAGSVTLQAQRSGSNVAGAVLTTSALPDAVWFTDPQTWTQGQTLGLVLSTTSDFAPTSQIVVATAWIGLLI